jgi:hypothetical protein
VTDENEVVTVCPEFENDRHSKEVKILYLNVLFVNVLNVLYDCKNIDISKHVYLLSVGYFIFKCYLLNFWFLNIFF